MLWSYVYLYRYIIKYFHWLYNTCFYSIINGTAPFPGRCHRQWDRDADHNANNIH